MGDVESWKGILGAITTSDDELVASFPSHPPLGLPGDPCFAPPFFPFPFPLPLLFFFALPDDGLDDLPLDACDLLPLFALKGLAAAAAALFSLNLEISNRVDGFMSVRQMTTGARRPPEGITP